MESTATTTNENVVPSIALGKLRVEATTDVEGCNPSTSPTPPEDVWDEVNMLRKTLKANSRGYLAHAVALIIGACFLISVVVGTGLAMPLVVVVAAYDHACKFFSKRKEEKKSTSVLSAVPGSEVE